jgi:hypothetical protein
MTPAVKAKDPERQTYVVCLECGKRFGYDPVRMRVGKPLAPLKD